jgi:D-aspartate ligase
LTVLWGDDDMVRALGLAGLSCTLVADAAVAARYSRFVTGVIDERDADVVERLLEHAAAAPDRPVLFLQRDHALAAVSEQRERVEAAYRVPLPAPDVLAMVREKERFQAEAERVGLPVPRAVVVTNGATALERLRPPLLIKPAVRDGSWGPKVGWAKALAVADEEAWDRMRPKLPGLGARLIVQEAVPGGEDRIESYHAYVRADGEILAEFTGRKLRTWPASYGRSTALVTTDAADVRALGREAVARLDVTGPLKADFKRDPDGRLWLLEVNPRFTLWVHLGAVAGVNLARVAYDDLSGRPARAPGAARPGVSWCHPRADIAAWRSAGGSLWKWAGFALRCQARSGAQLDDPLPAIAGQVWPRLVGHK